MQDWLNITVCQMAIISRVCACRQGAQKRVGRPASEEPKKKFKSYKAQEGETGKVTVE
jgi:hypothetical protein